MIEVALGEFVAPPLEQVARQQKAFSKFQDLSFGTGGGSWVRDGNLILGVSRQTGEQQFGGMLVFELSPEASPDVDRSRGQCHRRAESNLGAHGLR